MCWRRRVTATPPRAPRLAQPTSPTRCGGATTRLPPPDRQLGGGGLPGFCDRVTLRFGATYGGSVLADHVLTGFDGRTATQAIEDGVDPRDVWRALCVDFDVPREQW